MEVRVIAVRFLPERTVRYFFTGDGNKCSKGTDLDGVDDDTYSVFGELFKKNRIGLLNGLAPTTTEFSNSGRIICSCSLFFSNVTRI